jgi:hypothetical protein
VKRGEPIASALSFYRIQSLFLVSDYHVYVVDANGGTANFHVVPPPQQLGYMDPYDMYVMDEVDEEKRRR